MWYGTHLNEKEKFLATNTQKSISPQIWASGNLRGHFGWSLPSDMLSHITNHKCNAPPFPSQSIWHVPVGEQLPVWSMHDKAPPHHLNLVRQHPYQVSVAEDKMQRPRQLAWTISLDFSFCGNWRLNVFDTDQCLRNITSTNREFLTEKWSKPRHFRQSTRLCATKSWRLF
jgi:hypothetical protein